jgi:hypothetical protein
VKKHSVVAELENWRLHKSWKIYISNKFNIYAEEELKYELATFEGTI